MKLRIDRLFLEDEYTEGQMFIDGVYFCDTLEDKTRDYNKDGDLDEPGEKKVYGETSIPFGTYKVIMSYSHRFKKEMPELLNVTGFDGIRIHAGNTPKDTLGCILVGRATNEGDGTIIRSREFTAKLYEIINDAIKKGEDVTITIQ